MGRMVVLFCFACICFFCKSLSAEADPKTVVEPTTERWAALADPVFHHLTLENGLPNIQVTAMREDRDGFVWFGTMGGLGRWDGYHFQIYPPDAKVAGALPGGFISILHLDAHKQLWIGSYLSGLVRYDREHDSFIRIPLGSNGVSDVGIKDIVDDRSGGIWVTTRKGIDHLGPDGIAIGHLHGGDRGLPRNFQPQSLLLDRDGKLWIGTQRGLLVEGNTGGEFVTVPLPVHRELPPMVFRMAQSSDGKVWICTTTDGAFVIEAGKSTGAQAVWNNGDQHYGALTVVEAQSGEVWIGTDHGVLAVDTATLQVRILRHESGVPTTLPSNQVNSLLRDHSGLVWVGTDGGASYTDPRQRAILNVFGGAGKANGISDPGVPAILQMNDGRIWLGLYNNTIDVVDREATRIMPLEASLHRPAAKLPMTVVRAMAGPLDGAAFVCGNSGLFRIDLATGRTREVKFPTPMECTALFMEGTKLWVGRTNGVWSVVSTGGGTDQVTLATGTQQLAKDSITHLRAAHGNLWIGTQHGGLYRFDTASGSLLHFRADPADITTLQTDTVISMLFDSRDRLWIGTDAGLSVLDTATAAAQPHVKRIGREQGLPNDSVDAMLEDANGNIWIGTDAGIATVDTSTYAVQALVQADGVVIPSYIWGSAAKTDSGELLFGGTGGLTIVRPELYHAWKYQAPVVISEVKLGGTPIPSARFNDPESIGAPPLTVNPAVNSFSVEFSALDYSAPKRNRYAYRLDGYDKDWIETDWAHRQVSYTNLPPGNYSLRLRGSNRNGEWTERSIALPIHILPAWYQTWWMRAIEILAAIAAVAALVQMRTRQLRKRRGELEREVMLRTTELIGRNHELQVANESLAVANEIQAQQKSELTRFLAVASHDLRQPMHALNLYLGALLNVEVPEAARSLLGNLRKCSSIMEDMFMALLDLSRLDAGVVKPQMVSFPIEATLKRLEVEFVPHAQSKGLTLTFESSSAWVESDASLVQQILGNLIANAIRYTEKGAVGVRCYAHGNRLRVSVQDTGIGISVHQQKTIFEEFCQLGNSSHDRTKGLGLGLAIVKRLSTLLETPITLVSEPGKGSIFSVELLLASNQEASLSENSHHESKDGDESMRGKVVVVIDDEANILDSMRLLLEQWECTVTTAHSGREAIAKLVNAGIQPDALICDFRLRSQENGIDAINALRGEFNKEIPALVMTGDTAPDLIHDTLASGLPVMYKPVSAVALRETLLRLMRKPMVAM